MYVGYMNQERNQKSGRYRSKYTLDETVFATMTDETAYWVGFILADGNVDKPELGTSRLRLCCNVRDRAHLEIFRDFVCSNKPIYELKSTNAVSFEVSSKRMLVDLKNYWFIVPKKSNVAEVHPALRTSPHFWRGMIDGDGSVGKDKRPRYYIRLVGTKNVCDCWADYAERICGFRCKVGQDKRSPNQYWAVYSGPRAEKLIQHLYLDHTGPALARKKGVYASLATN